MTATRLTIKENLAVAFNRGEKRGLTLGVKGKQYVIFKEQLKLMELGLEAG